MTKPHMKYLKMGPAHIHVAVSTDLKAVQAEWERLSEIPFVGCKDVYGTVWELANIKGGGRCFLVYFSPELYDSEIASLAGVVAHESAHIAQMYWKFIGEREIGMEADAYLIQYLTTSFMWHVLQQKKKAKKKCK